MESSAVVTPPYLAGPLRLHCFTALALQPSHIGDPASARLFARPYRAVAQRLTQWQSRGRLLSDTSPALYLHEYTATGITVRGLVGAMDLTRRALHPGERAVLPHEGIHPRQADELADRMEEMLVNPAPILLVHRGTDRLRALVDELAATTPLWDYDDRGGQRHRIWALRDEQGQEAVRAEIAGSRALIADGHHRYAAYLRVQGRMPGGPADRGLVMLIDQRDTPLHLGAIHRNLHGVALDDFERAVTACGLSLTRLAQHSALAALAHDTFLLTDGDQWAAVRLRLEGRTVVEGLHDALVPALPRGPQAVSFHHSVEEALARRRSGALTVLLPAPTVDEVIASATAGRLLPEKATSFQPKPHPGVLIRSLRDG